MKKIRNVLIAIAVFSSLSVAAFASTNSGDSSAPAASDSATNSGDSSAPASSDSATSSDSKEESKTESKPATDDKNTGSKPATEDKNTNNKEDNVDTGIGGIAAVAGVVTLAGAALAISRKRK